MMTSNQALSLLSAVLTKNEYPRSYLGELHHFLGFSQTAVSELSETQENALQQSLNLLAKQVPVEYIVGRALFFERWYKVTPDVLIPRFDTEGLVKKALAVAKDATTPLTIIDIGTGSGALIITMAKELANFVNADYIAVDISEPALAVAKQNAETQGVLKQIQFQNADTFPRNLQNVPLIPDSKTVLIISNPPYISEAHMERLPDSVKYYEPAIALKEQDNFIEKLGYYISSLEEVKKTIYLCLEYNNKEGVMTQFSLNTQNWRSILNSLANKSL